MKFRINLPHGSNLSIKNLKASNFLCFFHHIFQGSIQNCEKKVSTLDKGKNSVIIYISKEALLKSDCIVKENVILVFKNVRRKIFLTKKFKIQIQMSLDFFPAEKNSPFFSKKMKETEFLSQTQIVLSLYLYNLIM